MYLYIYIHLYRIHILYTVYNVMYTGQAAKSEDNKLLLSKCYKCFVL